MKCPNCGKDVKNDRDVCPYCGTKLSTCKRKKKLHFLFKNVCSFREIV